jgi:hypothetical protein
MPKSARDLYNRSLELLGVAAAGQAPAAEDWQAMRDTIGPLLEELRVTEAANIVLTAGNESATDIPDECFGPLSIILANDAAPGFGQPMLTGTDREVKLIRPLRATTYGNYQGFTQDVNFF